MDFPKLFQSLQLTSSLDYLHVWFFFLLLCFAFFFLRHLAAVFFFFCSFFRRTLVAYCMLSAIGQYFVAAPINMHEIDTSVFHPK